MELQALTQHYGGFITRGSQMAWQNVLDLAPTGPSLDNNLAFFSFIALFFIYILNHQSMDVKVYLMD